MLPSELLADPKKWTKGEFARDSDGRVTRVLSQDACQFCLLGAIGRCGMPWLTYESKILASIKKVTGVGYILVSWFNDEPTTTHEQVIAVLKEAGL